MSNPMLEEKGNARYTKNGKPVAITFDQKTGEYGYRVLGRANVIYSPVYWNVEKTTAEGFADYLGLTLHWEGLK